MRELRAPIVVLLALSLGCTPAPTKDEQRARAIEDTFIGSYVGTLEFLNDAGQRLSLPVSMMGKRLSTGSVELTIERVVQPGAVPESAGVESRLVTRLRVLGASRELEYTSGDGARTERFRIERFAAFTGLGELIVTGSTQEAGQPVELRILYSIEPGKLTWTRDSRPPGGEFRFRHRYTMRRGR